MKAKKDRTQRSEVCEQKHDEWNITSSFEAAPGEQHMLKARCITACRIESTEVEPVLPKLLKAGGRIGSKGFPKHVAPQLEQAMQPLRGLGAGIAPNAMANGPTLLDLLSFVSLPRSTDR
jgi:hypothetical protein